MSNPLTFLRPLRYDRVHTVLLVQSGPIDVALAVAERVRALFPGCDLAAVVADRDAGAIAGAGFSDVVLVRWEERREVLRRLRARRYDAVVVLLTAGGSDYLRLLPCLLRTKAILAFNDRLDYFPLHASRLATLAYHVSGRANATALARWMIARALLWPATIAVLTASVARLYVRAALRHTRTALTPSRR